jgi:hypothetical protein
MLVIPVLIEVISAADNEYTFFLTSTANGLTGGVKRTALENNRALATGPHLIISFCCLEATVVAECLFSALRSANNAMATPDDNRNNFFMLLVFGLGKIMPGQDYAGREIAEMK